MTLKEEEKTVAMPLRRHRHHQTLEATLAALSLRGCDGTPPIVLSEMFALSAALFGQLRHHAEKIRDIRRHLAAGKFPVQTAEVDRDSFRVAPRRIIRHPPKAKINLANRRSLS